MANHEILVPFVLKCEGGYAEVKDDRGGATNKGVTLTTFQMVYGGDKTKADLKQLTDTQWAHIFKTLFWDKCQGDQLPDQSIANLLVDYAYHSGVVTAVKALQRVLGVKADGIIGKQTLQALGQKSPLPVFGALKQQRLKFFKSICTHNPSQKKFLNGWTKRVQRIVYGKPYFTE